MNPKLLLACSLLACIAPAQSAMTLVTNSPSAWRMENYAGPSGVTIWFTSSPCSAGQVTFGSSATQADMNRLWATVTTAKTTGRKMFLYFDNANAPASCPIISFGLDAE